MQFLGFGANAGHGDRPAYSVTPGGRGAIFWALPCTSGPYEAADRFFELSSIHYKDFGDRPASVYSRTWAYERAERLDSRATGPLAAYARLTRAVIDKPYAWWRDRGMLRRE